MSQKELQRVAVISSCVKGNLACARAAGPATVAFPTPCASRSCDYVSNAADQGIAASLVFITNEGDREYLNVHSKTSTTPCSYHAAGGSDLASRAILG